MGTYLTTEEEDAILADYHAGMQGYAIAEKHGRAAATIFRVVKRRGELGRRVGRTGRTSPLEAIHDELRAAYEGGATVAELATRCGMSESNVGRWLSNHGVALRHRVAWQPTDGQWEEILSEYKAGIVPVKDIAVKHGAGANRLWQLLNERGVTGKRLREARGRFLPDDHKKMVGLYEDGLTMEVIASQFGCSRLGVRKILLTNGVVPRSPARPEREFSAEQVADMAQRWLSGESQQSIARSYHTHQIKVSNLMRVYGSEFRVRAWRASRGSHGGWKGGRVIDENGYVRILMEATDPLYCMAMKHGYVLEHRLVMARTLGRPLTRRETVHHINGVRGDNRPENLQLRQGRHGKGVVLVCAHCGSNDIVTAPLSDVA